MPAGEPKLTLYDLAALERQPISPYAWQSRMALNYKGLPFNTVWLNFVDIKQTLQSIGAAPTPFPFEPEGQLYTVPVLVDASSPGSPAVISGALNIAEYLDEKYTQRPIFPKGSKALLNLYHEYLLQHVFISIVPLVIGAVPPLIAECDHAYFRETRERWLGAKLEDISPPGQKREEHVEKLKKEFDALGEILVKNGKEKVLVMGDQPSVGDFTLVALLAWMEACQPDLLEKVKTWNEGRWGRLWIESEDWRKNTK